MDTKFKKSNPLAVWLAFFIGINLIAVSTLGGILLANYSNSIIAKDYKDTSSFKINIETNFQMILEALTGTQDYVFGSNNLSYFGTLVNGENSNGQVVKTNMSLESFDEAVDYLKGKPKEYNYLFIFDGSHFSIIDDTKSIDPYSDNEYHRMINNYKSMKNPGLTDLKIVMGVKSQFDTHAGGIYSSYLEWKLLKFAVPADAICFIIGVILLVISSVKRTSRKEFSRRLGNNLGKIWLEIKILITFLILNLTVSIGGFSSDVIILVIFFWWAYLMLLDLYVNKIGFFKNNSITWLLRLYRSYESKKPFQKGMLMRFLLFIGIEAVLIFFTFISVSSGSGPVALLLIALGAYLFFRYLKEYTKLITDIGLVVDQTELIRNGDLNTKLVLDNASNMYKTSEDLNNLQEGVFTAVQEQLKSEKMKIELITNVSHDIKTPLTAIVNYIDLLGRENLTPEYANDYVKVLSKKAARLTTLTQDIFDISKAHSGNLELNIEKIDIVELVNQSLAELDERILESSLCFKLNLPKEKIYINADGRKLYRVFDNLISNILKYSLENSRVYIELQEEETQVALSFKNISSYELNMSTEDLMERFTRGDESRSTEGSGLGLAIVESFVTLCGGSFEINIDGDLFKAIVKFKKV